MESPDLDIWMMLLDQTPVVVRWAFGLLAVFIFWLLYLLMRVGLQRMRSTDSQLVSLRERVNSLERAPDELHQVLERISRVETAQKEIYTMVIKMQHSSLVYGRDSPFDKGDE